MNWSDIQGHETQKELLKGSKRRGRIAHTYLFVGPEGVGKSLFARVFAQCLLCEKYKHTELEACGECSGCRQVMAGTHPDLFVVGCPEGKREIPVSTFVGEDERRGKSGLLYDLSHTPMAGGYKVAIINDAEYLNDAGSNMLLKTLEEPPPHSLIMLITSSMDAILPTIRSRSQVLWFHTLPQKQIAEILLKTGAASDLEQASIAAASAEGSVAQAIRLLSDDAVKKRVELFELLAAAPFNSLQVVSFVMQQIESAGSEVALQRVEANNCIRTCIEFFRAALVALVSGSTTSIPQAANYVKQLQLASPDHITRLTQAIERLVLASTHLDQNVGVPLTVEACFDELGKLLR